ncbi:MAG: tRNA 2-thiouridine(34) synthase MnmA [Chloroflexi bacterium]|nr:tRNA 2-thiouridine(34) synthase MnmA [Chloroflexota bacterium]
MRFRKRVVVAMSGGVDSSVAAALLVKQGYEVIGLMMRLWGEPPSPDGRAPQAGGVARAGGAGQLPSPDGRAPQAGGVARAGGAGQLPSPNGRGAGGEGNRCCTPDAMAQARRVADQFDIPFYAIDAQAPFKSRVVDFFVEGYAAGVTPNPCLECNRHIRWDFLLNRALALGAEYLATGHYARVRQDTNYQLLKARDEKKDQSYVLSVMGQAQLRHAMFPVGEYTKAEVRNLARELGLPVAERPESQDLCFLADGNYRRFLADHAPAAVHSGPIVSTSGDFLGEHRGLPFYTIGQRKGIGVAAPEALYVIGTDPARNALIVGSEAELGNDRLTAARVNWIAGSLPPGPIRASVKIRYKAAEAPATITPSGADRVEVVFDHRLRDITPGQAAVFYEGEICLGGGIISQ